MCSCRSCAEITNVEFVDGENEKQDIYKKDETVKWMYDHLSIALCVEMKQDQYFKMNSEHRRKAVNWILKQELCHHLSERVNNFTAASCITCKTFERNFVYFTEQEIN